MPRAVIPAATTASADPATVRRLPSPRCFVGLTFSPSHPDWVRDLRRGAAPLLIGTGPCAAPHSHTGRRDSRRADEGAKHLKSDCYENVTVLRDIAHDIS